MKRKILSLILVFAMTVSLLTVGTGAVEPTYGDTAGHWAESSIERWSGHGIIQGSNGEFDPNGQLTCAQLATILAKLLKLPAAKDAGFTDNTADAWYYDAINRCAAAGILNGNGDGTVTPNNAGAKDTYVITAGGGQSLERKSANTSNPFTFSGSGWGHNVGMSQWGAFAMAEQGYTGTFTVAACAETRAHVRTICEMILGKKMTKYFDKQILFREVTDGEKLNLAGFDISSRTRISLPPPASTRSVVPSDLIVKQVL